MFWKKPWKLKEGFLIGAALIVLSLILQVVSGPVSWEKFAWPVNIVVLGALLLFIIFGYALRRRLYFLQFFMTMAAAVPAMTYAVVMTTVMGLVRQQDDGSWLGSMLTFWPFVVIYAYVVVILGLVIVRQAKTAALGLVRGEGFSSTFLRSSLFIHLGLFMALTTGTLGNADMKQLQMWTTNNPEMANTLSESNMFQKYQRTAIDHNDRKVELPLAVELKRFIMEKHDDGSPRRFASELVVYSKSSMHQFAATVDVNHPVEIDGWKIYQKDFRLTEAGDKCQISILELVRDPWLPWVYAGIYLMLGGALLLLVFGKRKRQPLADNN